jgi:hypothetical protein
VFRSKSCVVVLVAPGLLTLLLMLMLLYVGRMPLRLMGRNPYYPQDITAVLTGEPGFLCLRSRLCGASLSGSVVGVPVPSFSSFPVVVLA